MLGRTFGDFIIKARLGEGGAGELYLAEQVTLGREAVIKVMAKRNEVSANATERFLREAQLASSLDHPFAAHIYGFGKELDDTLWIAMELVRGMPLNTIIKDQGAIPLARFVPLLDRLAEVLQAAHEQGIVHRDIKPGNVMVISRAGRLLPKLLDLGIARRDLDAEGQSREVFASTPSQFSAQLTEGKTLSETMANQLVESETAQLTHVGVIVGSPHYMAPEQWVDAASVDARADIYSLALLAYQAVTGKLPFDAKTIRGLAKAHGSAPLPDDPQTLSAALHAVLSKGAAKQPAHRFETAVEFAAAFRAASGIGVEPFVLPQLDEGVRENVLSEAPQPIAEAAALLEAARTPRGQLEAVMVVRHVVVRYLGVLALAARARVGSGATTDAPEVLAALQRLAHGRLNDDEWLQLAQDLCRPFASKKAAHPLPELVSFFFESKGSLTSGPGLKTLSDFNAAGSVSKEAPDDVVFAALLRLVPAIGRVLQLLSFLFDYSLVVRRQDTERWMGTRRVRRLVQGLVDPVPPAGIPILVDAVGILALSLFPLVQVFSPGGEMPDELFFIDGEGRHGARLVALPGPYERQSSEVWPWLSAAVVGLTHGSEGAAADERAPYKGLSTFTAKDADNFFGREKEAESFANRIRFSPLLAVVGPSGAGKSSFVLAGVLPLLPQGFRPVVMRPGPNPLSTLASRLTAAGFNSALTSVVDSLKADESVLLVVDQFEELVTLCADAAERAAFSQLLVDAALNSSGRMRVVLTLRDDFLIRVQQLPALRERLSSSLQLLGTPAKEDLLRVVSEPARRVGYGFDDESLPQKMVEEVAEYPGALALLSFTASQLWELRDRHLKQMRGKTYEALGGVGGALAHHAEMTLSHMSVDAQKLVREAFRHLVTSQGTRAVLSKKEMMEVLGASSTGAEVLEKLISARLLVSSEDATGDDRVEIIHEALISSWPRLVNWLREDAETARLRDSLRASARQWEERGRPTGLLWRAETLAEYRIWRTRSVGNLTAAEEAFARASLADELRSRRIRQALALSIFFGLVTGLVLVTRAYRAADTSSQLAQAALLQTQEEAVRVATVGNRILEAREALARAAANGFDTPLLRALSGILKFKSQGDGRVLDERDASVIKIAAAGDIVAVLWSDEQLAFWQHGTKRLQVKVPCGEMLAAERSGLFVLGCSDGTIELFRTEDLTHPETIRIDPTIVFSMELSTDEQTLSIGSYENMYAVDMSSKKVTSRGRFKNGATGLVQVNADGSRFAVYAGTFQPDDTTPHGVVISRRDGTKIASFLDDEIITTVLFAGDGLILGTESGEILKVNLSRNNIEWRTRMPREKVLFLAMTSTGHLLAQNQHSFVVTDLATGVALASQTFSDRISVCWVAPKAPTFAIGTGGGSVQLYEVPSGALRWDFVGHTRVPSAGIEIDGQIYSGSRDGSLRVWNSATSTAKRVRMEAPVLALAARQDSSGTFAAKADGVYEIGIDLVPSRILEQAIDEASIVTLVASRAGKTLALLRGSSVEIIRPPSHSQKPLLWKLPGPSIEGLLSADSTRLAVLISPEAYVVVLDVLTGEVTSTVRMDRMPLTLGQFVGNQTLLTCSPTGDRREFRLDAPSATLIRATSPHKDYCSLRETEHGSMTFSLEGALIDEAKPERNISGLERLTAASASTNQALTIQGMWVSWSQHREIGRQSLAPMDVGNAQFDANGNLWYLNAKKELMFFAMIAESEVQWQGTRTLGGETLR